MKKTLFLLLILSQNAFVKETSPVKHPDFYYRMGGENSFVLPPTKDMKTIILDLSVNSRVGNHCGSFNPAISIKNNLNQIKKEARELKEVIIKNATSAIAQLPLYQLSRMNPNLYHLLNSQLLRARKEIAVSTKSCEKVLQDINRGNNPYDDWVQLSAVDLWKKKSSEARYSGTGDINEAKKSVENDLGNHGIPWVGGKNSGGKNQKSIRIIEDTVKSGYDFSAVTGIWRNKDEAARWIVSIVGDSIVSLCPSSSCKNSINIGKGIFQEISHVADIVEKLLREIVSEQVAMGKENLKKLSAPGVVLSASIIHAIQVMPPLEQDSSIKKLSQELALHQVIEKVLLARRVLQIGRQVPEIAVNSLAQQYIQAILKQLDSDLETLRLENSLRRDLLLDTINTILQFNRQVQSETLNWEKSR